MDSYCFFSLPYYVFLSSTSPITGGCVRNYSAAHCILYNITGCLFYTKRVVASSVRFS